MTTQKTQLEQELIDKQMHDATCQHQSTIDALRSALNRALIGKDEIIEESRSRWHRRARAAFQRAVCVCARVLVCLN